MGDTNKKIENVIKLSEEDRYNYFIRKVADFEEVWGLNNDGWALLGNDLNNQIFPFWPEKEFAEICATEQWLGYSPQSISLDAFLEKWIPGMINDKLLVSIFQTPKSKGSIVNPQKLMNDINEELSQYE
jgi:hypothetical protein